jgi:hypothetical protein
MLKMKLCIVVTLLLVMVCCGCVVAGPKNPTYGDPDIYEGTRGKGNVSQWELHDQMGSDLVIEIPWLGRIVVKRQGQGYHLRKMAERLPAALNKDISER